MCDNHKDAVLWIVLWIGFCLSYFLFCRASELWAYDKTGLIHADYCLLWSDVQWKLNGHVITDWRQADAVTVKFRASKSDQQRRGASIDKSDYTVQLLQCLKEHVPTGLTGPLMSYRNTQSTIATLHRDEATAALRRMISSIHSQYPASEYALHSGRIGAATQMASQGVSDQLICAAGRWKQASSFTPYIRPNQGDAQTVSAALLMS